MEFDVSVGVSGIVEMTATVSTTMTPTITTKIDYDEGSSRRRLTQPEGRFLEGYSIAVGNVSAENFLP